MLAEVAAHFGQPVRVEVRVCAFRGRTVVERPWAVRAGSAGGQRVRAACAGGACVCGVCARGQRTCVRTVCVCVRAACVRGQRICGRAAYVDMCHARIASHCIASTARVGSAACRMPSLEREHADARQKQNNDKLLLPLQCSPIFTF